MCKAVRANWSKHGGVQTLVQLENQHSDDMARVSARHRVELAHAKSDKQVHSCLFVIYYYS
jgi:hypothetical protein